jgi:hypothetical protein
MATTNEYARELVQYEQTPKAVYAAIALSFAMRLNAEDFIEAERAVEDEWRILHDNGIVPQKPPAAIAKATGKVG